MAQAQHGPHAKLSPVQVQKVPLNSLARKQSHVISSIEFQAEGDEALSLPIVDLELSENRHKKDPAPLHKVALYDLDYDDPLDEVRLDGGGTKSFNPKLRSVSISTYAIFRVSINTDIAILIGSIISGAIS